MSAIRLLRLATRRATTFSLARRGYADVSDKLNLSLALPHQVRQYKACRHVFSDTKCRLPLTRRGTSECACGVGGYGYSRKSCSLDKTVASWRCGGH